MRAAYFTSLLHLMKRVTRIRIRWQVGISHLNGSPSYLFPRLPRPRKRLRQESPGSRVDLILPWAYTPQPIKSKYPIISSMRSSIKDVRRRRGGANIGKKISDVLYSLHLASWLTPASASSFPFMIQPKFPLPRESRNLSDFRSILMSGHLSRMMENDNIWISE